MDLQRLDYLHGLTQNTDLAAQYEPALARLAEMYTKPYPSARSSLPARPQARREAGDNVAAVALTRAAEARFPQVARGGGGPAAARRD